MCTNRPTDAVVFVPARASGRASLQELWGLSSDSAPLAQPLRRGIREDPGRDQLCTACILAPEISDTVCVRGRLPRTIYLSSPVCRFLARSISHFAHFFPLRCSPPSQYVCYYLHPHCSATTHNLHPARSLFPFFILDIFSTALHLTG